MADPFLLDTNILILLVRNGKIGKYIQHEYGLATSPFRPQISIISVGESMKLARKNNWGNDKMERLVSLYKALPWINIDNEKIADVYAELELFCETHSQRMGQQNDIWIAATTKVTEFTLLTTDKDFNFLHEQKIIKRIWIDPHGKYESSDD